MERDDLEHYSAWVETPTLEGRRALYDGEIRANDHHFERLLEELERLELLKDTLVIFLADHGEHLGERGLWEHHDPTYVQVLHVPLFDGLIPSVSGREFAWPSLSSSWT